MVSLVYAKHSWWSFVAQGRGIELCIVYEYPALTRRSASDRIVRSQFRLSIDAKVRNWISLNKSSQSRSRTFHNNEPIIVGKPRGSLAECIRDWNTRLKIGLTERSYEQQNNNTWTHIIVYHRTFPAHISPGMSCASLSKSEEVNMTASSLSDWPNKKVRWIDVSGVTEHGCLR